MAFQDTPMWRGLLAWTLLADTWPGSEPLEGTVPGDTRLQRMLSAAQGEIRLITARRNGKAFALGIVSAQYGIQPAADLRLLDHFVPAEVTWYDREKHDFQSPGPWLDESRRDLLLHRLRLLSANGADAVVPFARDLAAESLAFSETVKAEAGQEQLASLAAIILGLQGEPGFDALAERTERCIPGVNPLLNALGLVEKQRVFPASTLWVWQDAPIIRGSSLTGFAPVPGSESIRNALRTETQALRDALPAWNQRLGRRLRDWLLEAAHARVTAESRACLENTRREAERRGSQPQQQVTLQWPWRTREGSSALILRELAGEAALPELEHPFSDWVLRLPLRHDHPAEGMIRTKGCCMPAPISAALAERMTESAFLSLRAEDEENGLLVSFSPDGEEKLLLRRLYPPQEQASILPEDVPHITLWPGLRLPEDRWRGYWTCLRSRQLGFSIWDGDHWYAAEQSVLRTPKAPNLISLTLESRGEAGVLFSPAQEVQPAAQGEAIIGFDFGAVGSAAVIRLAGEQEPFSLPGLTLTLLGDEETESAFPENCGPIFSSVAQAENPKGELFAEVRGVMPRSTAQMAALPQAGLYTDLKWSPGEAAMRQRYLEEWMTAVLLCAVLRGATSAAWRFALPSGMAGGGRTLLWEMLRQTARSCCEAAGVPVGSTPAAWLTEEDAIAACLREEWAQRGAVLLMDMGGAHAGLSLRLRGLDRAVCGCATSLGLQSVLLSVYLREPELLRNDLDGLPEGDARRDGMALADRLTAARGSADALASARVMLDVYLGEYLPVLMPCLEAQRGMGKISVLQSLLLLTGAALMTQAGVMLETVYQDATMNDHLPAEVAVCLAGRGSVPLCMLPQREQEQLARFVRMGMHTRHPVNALRLEPSRWPKLEAALGLTATRCLVDSPVRLPGTMLRLQMPEGMEQRFLMMFRAVYPDACERLFPGLTRTDGAGAVFLENAEQVYNVTARRRSLRGDPESFTATLMELVTPEVIRPAAPPMDAEGAEESSDSDE